MSNMVTLKNGDTFYPIPVHEFTRYWLPVLMKKVGFLEVRSIPDEIPYASKLAALKRGKGFKRYYKSMNQKGSGKHATRHD